MLRSVAMLALLLCCAGCPAKWLTAIGSTATAVKDICAALADGTAGLRASPGVCARSWAAAPKP